MNSTVSPSTALASDTLTAGAELPVAPESKAIVAEVVFESFLPASVHIAPVAAQSSVAGSVTVTSSLDRGRTVIVQRWFCPPVTRRAPVTRPLVACSASSLRTL